MPPTKGERRYLNRFLEHLAWKVLDLEEVKDDPPDFLVTTEAERVAVEVTRIYLREHPRKGSPDAAREGAWARFITSLAEQYYDPATLPGIKVAVTLPSPIEGPAVRRTTLADYEEELRALLPRALARLRHLPKLAPWQEREFEVRVRDGRPAHFRAQGLPAEAGAYRRWQVTNSGIGWQADVDTGRLQAKVALKAQDLTRYRHTADRRVLLVVADGDRASGFLELPAGVVIDPHGFDAVYFQRYALWTRPVALSAKGSTRRRAKRHD